MSGVNLQITEDYRIRTDSRNWILERRKDPEKAPIKKAQEGSDREIKWKPWGFYPSLSGAITGLYSLQIKLSDAESLEDLQEESRRILKEIGDGLGVEYKITVEAVRSE